MKKILLFGAGTLIVLAVVAVIGIVLLAGSLARAGIEAGATYALGVKTTLGSARVGVFSGQFGMSGLNVANPQGFPASHFLTLGDAGVAVSLTSLTKDIIRVPTFSLDSLDVNLERKGGTANYDVILMNLQKLSGPKDPNAPKPAPSKDGGKRLVIDELTITNVKVHADVPGVGDLTGSKVDVPIKEIKLRNVGKTGTGVAGSGVTVGELTSIIVQAVFAAVIENGGNLLPKDMLNDLGGQLKQLDGLVNVGVEVGGKAVDVAKDIGQHAAQVGQEAAKTVEGAAKEAEKTLKGIGEGVGGILGGDKKKKGGG
jgi:uncharacterized protein involved in outer membrane biogenesis